MSILYPKSLEDYIKRNNFCPILLEKNILKLNTRYYNINSEEHYKVLDIYTCNDHKYYYVKGREHRYHNISDPVKGKIYKLIEVKKKEYKDLYIINNNKFYYGYEIIYWFWANNIDLESDIYCKFKSFVDCRSDNCISMNKRYKVLARKDPVQGVFYKIRFILEKAKRR